MIPLETGRLGEKGDFRLKGGTGRGSRFLKK
jgi:hypothetical protein